MQAPQQLQIESVHIKNFKRISEATIPLGDITYLVGGNNSGKSSILQAIHTAFSCARLSLERGTFNSKSYGSPAIIPAKVLPEVELLYRPTSSFIDLGHKEQYRGKNKHSGQVAFVGVDSTNNQPESLTVSMYKAHNHNNAGVDLDDDSRNIFKLAIRDDSTLFSVYVPGLTGIPLYEEHKSLGAIRRTAAGGEANLVFRNILYHLASADLQKLEKYLGRTLNEAVKFDINFDPERDQYIDVKLTLGGSKPIPVDLWGTGVLQVTQILAYALLFRPYLFLIDEPDSHLHPSWQKTLAATFETIAQTLGCRVVITTHSRHMVTAATEDTRVVWMKDGRVEHSDAKEVVELLLDLGALDNFDSDAAYILYTEDSQRSALSTCIETLHKQGRIPMVNILPYNGKNNTQLLASIDTGTQILKRERRLILHRDRDYLTEDEVQAWGKPFEDGRHVGSERTGHPTGRLDPMLVFIPKFNDTESYYCQPEHLHACLGISMEEARGLVRRIFDNNEEEFKRLFQNGRTAANNSECLWPQGGSPETEALWEKYSSETPLDWRLIHGKTMLRLIKNDPTVARRSSKIEATPSAALTEEFLAFFKLHFTDS